MTDYKATAQACSNIAFIKYWGKTDYELNLPLNDSISMTLSEAVTTTTVVWDEQLESDWFTLPRRIRIEKIQFNDRDVESKGSYSVEFTPNGEVVGHYVTLLSLDIAHPTRRRLTLSLNPITGLVSYDRGEKKFALVRSEFEFRR